jgi:5'-phosphate synthase pdxT subunit
VVAHDPAVRVLAEHDGLPVVLAHGRHLVATFHPELSAEDALHAHFIALCDAQGGAQGGAQGAERAAGGTAAAGA